MKMRPSFTSSYSCDGRRINSKLPFEHFPVSPFPRNIGVLNIFHLFLGKLMPSALFSARGLASALFHHVRSVVFVVPKKQVVRSNTCGIVAMVANKQSFWNGSKKQEPHSPCSANHMAFIPTAVSNNVSVSISLGCNPVPTPITHHDLAPKSSNECFGKTLRGEVFRSNLWLHKSVCRCALQGPPAFLLCYNGA